VFVKELVSRYDQLSQIPKLLSYIPPNTSLFKQIMVDVYQWEENNKLWKIFGALAS
jgi:hypothetical protein